MSKKKVGIMLEHLLLPSRFADGIIISSALLGQFSKLARSLSQFFSQADKIIDIQYYSLLKHLNTKIDLPSRN